MPPLPPYTRRQYTPNSPRPLLVLPRPSITASVDITIFADPIEASPALIAVFSQFPGAVRDTTLDQWIGGEEGNLIEAAPELFGSWLNLTIVGNVIAASPSLVGSWVSGVLVTVASTVISANPELRYGGIILQTVVAGEAAGANFLRWSQVRNLDFTITRSNMAGQAALPWRGTVYAIMRHGEDVIVYGRNGVGVLLPSGQTYDMRPLLPYGLKSKLAVCDTGEAHYFVDTQNRLWKLGQGLEILDYREWLSTLGSTIALTFNPDTKLLYIGDGTIGYVYNVDTGSMGKGPATVTGIGLQGGTLYVVASGAMTIPNFAITTDITDFGTRKGKTVNNFEVSVDTSLTLEGAIDYRLQKQASFLSTNWYPIDSRGHVYLNAYGYEFRFKVRATSAGWFHLDHLWAYGSVHAH